MIWILPLFPAQPRLAPIYNPVTHMVPPAFPLLLVFPALAIDLVLRKTERTGGWLKRLLLAIALGGIFLIVLIGVHWFFAKFLLSRHAENWVFAGNRWFGYGAGTGEWRTRFWHVDKASADADLVNTTAILISWALASGGAWLGLLFGEWMRRVKR